MTILSVMLVISALGAAIAMAIFTGHLPTFANWRQPPRSTRVLSVRETIALDPRRRIHLVQCGPRQVVLLTGGSQDVVVGWVQDP